MLIINIILFTSGICYATNVVPSTRASVTSIKSKRVVVDPGHNIRNNQEQSRDTQTTPRIPSPQDINLRSAPRYGNAKATDAQRVLYTNHGPGSHAYGSVPERPLSYVSSPVYQIKPEQSRSNLLASYFGILNNHDAYKAARSVDKPPDAPKSIVSQSLQKLQGIYSPSYNAFYQAKPIELASFSDFEYPSFTNINKLISQTQSASSPTVQAPMYKTSYPLSKITDYSQVYAPSIPAVSSITQLPGKTTQNPKQKDEVTVDVNGKKISVPVIQLQSNLDFSSPGVLPAFDSQPFLLSSNHPIESNVGFKFGTGPKFNMALQSSNVSPFSSPLSSFQGQIVPIQTANGSPQFPLYKGASIEAHPVTSNVPKAQGNYESLYSQPQLHFDKEHNGNVLPVNVRQNTAHPSVSTQGILNDVEIINKKNPQPHTPQPDDDDDNDDEDRDDERYQNPDKENDHSSEAVDEDERQPGKYFKESPLESDFKPSTSYPFKQYDEVFGKHRAQSDEDEDKPYSSYKNYSSDDDEEEEDPSSEYRAESSKSSHDSYEEEDEDEEEEESRKQEKRKEANESSDEIQPKRSKYYQKDFEREFEESYRKELPKQEYPHVKEVPEIDSYISPSPSKRQKNSNQSRVKHGKPNESRSQESRISRKNRKVPNTDFGDSTAFSSDIFAKTTPKVIYEESFGYKKPRTKKYSKRAKTEKFSPTKKTPKEDDYPHAAKYYKFKKPQTSSELTSEDSYPYFSERNWKLNKNSSPEETVIKSNVKQLSDPDDVTSFYRSGILSGQLRSLTNTEIFRDLTGI
ncbi:uncharacterized protein LOC143902186 [Temnothorax americanus]|uniref:uncharacterized protein LOC143902186 n=1 Tax=Temnothorax americanus TaxID=1964332 RepID=UPI004068A64F